MLILCNLTLLFVSGLDLLALNICLEKFLVTDPSKFNREGFPKAIYEFLECAYQKIAKDGNHWQRDIASQLGKYATKIK